MALWRTMLDDAVGVRRHPQRLSAVPGLPTRLSTRRAAQALVALLPGWISRGRAARIMRVFIDLRLQFSIATLELKVAIVQLTILFLQSFDLRLELFYVRGQVINLALLLIGLRLAVECEPTKGIFKEAEEGVWPAQVGLIDLPGHGIGQLRRHRARSLQKRKSKASREEVL
ncbi:MAG: hypothetical protein WCF57_18290 [Pyrinomonadaceae bacterium]